MSMYFSQKHTKQQDSYTASYENIFIAQGSRKMLKALYDNDIQVFQGLRSDETVLEDDLRKSQLNSALKLQSY